MDEFATYYNLFNLRPGYSPQDLKEAYKRLVKQWHPDRFASDPANLKIAEEKIKTINVAYEALKAHQEGSYAGVSSGASSYATSVKTHRTSPQDYFNDAKRLTRLGQYREAAEELTHAVKLESKYAAAYHLRGVLFTVLGFERRGGSDLSRAAALGIISFDYDNEVADFIRVCDDFKPFRHLLKKEITQDQRENPSTYSDSPNSENYTKETPQSGPPKSKASQAERSRVEDIYQERQRQRRLKEERLKEEKLNREKAGQRESDSAPQSSPEKTSTDNTSKPQQPQDIPSSNPPVEEFPNIPKPQTASFSIKIQPESDFSHQDTAISAMAINTNGKTVATGCVHGSINLWNYKNKRNFHILKGHESTVTHIVFSPDNQLLFSGSEDGSIRLWNMSDGSSIRSFMAHDGGVTAFEICFPRKIVITSGIDGVVRVWDLRGSKLLREILHHEAPIPNIALNPTGEIAVCGVEDGSIRFCHTLRGGIVKWFTAHSKSVQALIFSQDGQTFASGSANGEVGLWQFPSGDRRQTCQSAQSGITALTFCHQGRLLCGTDNQGRLMVWDVASGALLDTVFAHSPGNMNLITVADDTLLSAGADGCIRQWRLQVPS